MIIYTDGSCLTSNPGGYGGWGFVVYASQRDMENGAELYSDFGGFEPVPAMTNNRMEYEAVIQALDWATQHGHTGMTIYTDSQLVVKQVSGQFAVRSPHLKPLCKVVRQKIGECQATLKWTPREDNWRADQLSRVSYAEWNQFQSVKI